MTLYDELCVRRLVRSVSVVFLALALSGCATTTRQPDLAGAVCTESRVLADEPGAVTVDMENNPALPPFIASAVYAPSDISAKVGQVIVFRNADPDDQHTAELNSGACGTDYLDYKKRDTLVFKVAGSYPFYCLVHGTTMAGTITIVP